MKILWIKTDFLHPTTKGGHIRTLEMLKRLHRRHEIHYVAFADPAHPDQVVRAAEYATRAYPVPFRQVSKRSPAFLAELARGLVSPLPVAAERWKSPAMRRTVDQLLSTGGFDRVVCDFLSPALNISRLDRCVLFQHNVETAIWRRHRDHASSWLRRFYFRLQAERMYAHERTVCQTVHGVIAVSPVDAALMRDWFALPCVAEIPTGVDAGYFTPRPSAESSDLIFIGSMDWLPNIDGIGWFAREALPLIRAKRPGCTLAIVGRSPAPEIEALAHADPAIRVTGTVPDIRPYLWGATVSIVPLRIGGGTRLKIYESMAARVPVVSTAVGAEGLPVHPPEDIRIAVDPGAFAQACLDLLENPVERSRMASAGRELVERRFSWEEVARQFEAALQS
jgi:glycosyltransferase involved in cell wall biosynthesis